MNEENSFLHHCDPELGYKQLADLTGHSKSQVHDIVKLSAEWGYCNIHHAPHCSHPSIPHQTGAEIEKLNDDNPQMPLWEATKYRNNPIVEQVCNRQGQSSPV